jgi:hypothetical protein
MLAAQLVGKRQRSSARLSPRISVNGGSPTVSAERIA